MYYEYNRRSILCCKYFTRYWKSANVYDRVVNKLKLKPLRKVDMGVSAFLNKKESKMKLNEYEIVKSLYTDERKVTTALGVPKICTDIKKQSNRFAVEKYGFLQNLQLDCNIDLIIGSETYWEFVIGEIKLILNSRSFNQLCDDDTSDILMPNHLLFGRKLYQINPNFEHSYKEFQINMPKRVKHVENTKTEYPSSTKQKWFSVSVWW